jgi:hypothetical protein
VGDTVTDETVVMPRGPGEAQLRRVWLGALLPPLAWAADLITGMLLSRTGVATGRKWFLFLVYLAAAGVALAGVSLCHRVLRGRSPAEQEREFPADLLVAQVGRAMGVFFLILIAAMAFPTIVLDWRDIP